MKGDLLLCVIYPKGFGKLEEKKESAETGLLTKSFLLDRTGKTVWSFFILQCGNHPVF